MQHFRPIAIEQTMLNQRTMVNEGNLEGCPCSRPPFLPTQSKEPLLSAGGFWICHLGDICCLHQPAATGGHRVLRKNKGAAGCVKTTADPGRWFNGLSQNLLGFITTCATLCPSTHRAPLDGSGSRRVQGSSFKPKWMFSSAWPQQKR